MIDISEKKNKLASASTNLKKRFFGIDDTIDKIIDSISAWYLFPEISTRPQIVCLWGLTGVGKTDLIRQLCAELDVSSDFAEIQLDGNKNGQRDIGDILAHTTITPESHSVLLLDEVQRFKTKDEEGHDLMEGNMQDIWMLLSDGTLGSRNSLKIDLMNFLMELNSDIYAAEKRSNKSSKDDSNSVSGSDEADITEEDDEDDDSPFSWGRKYNANRLYRFDNSTPLEEYMQMDYYQQRDMVTALLADTNTFVPKPYRKMLIFISGNLDEAFHVATDTAESEINADLVYEETKKVNVLDIKTALRRRFKPEQIARFGNNYIIYPSLNKKAYDKIIERRIKDFTKSVNKVLKGNDIKVKITKNVNTMLYQNGVYPAQGARPILSTIDNFINNVIPKVIIACDSNGVTGEVSLSCSEKGFVSYKCGDLEGKVAFVGELDKIRDKQKSKKNLSAKVAVHEAGHAVLHCVEYGVAPKDVKISVASSFNNGFVYNSVVPSSKKELESYVKCCFGGTAAEELVFGKDNVSSGASSDLASASEKIALMIRYLGMGPNDSKVMVGDHTDKQIICTKETDAQMKTLSASLMKDTSAVLREHVDFLKDVSRELSAKKELSSKDMREIAKRNNLDILADASEDDHYGYNDVFNKWLS